MSPDLPMAVDTSVAVALLVQKHGEHERVSEWARGTALALCGHAVAETFSVLTRLPGDLRVAPPAAVQLIDGSFTRRPGPADPGMIERLVASGIAGGAVYDGLVALAAAEHDLRLATRDARARATYEALGVRVVLV